MLTGKQRHLLLFLREKLSEKGICPSFEEMRRALDLKSKSGVHRLIRSLEERGFIRRLPNRARALEVLRLPQEAASPGPVSRTPTPVRADDSGSPQWVRPAARSPFQRSDVGTSAADFSIPLYGRIAAGTPITALRDETERISVPAGMLGSGSYYALKVQGDSMIGAGIFEGDIAVIHHCDQARNHQIVVALIDREEVTLKRYLRKGKTIALEAANPAYETRIFGEEKIQIQGCLALLVRRYD